MPKYYFNRRQGRKLIKDNLGESFPGYDEAVQKAAGIAVEIVRERGAGKLMEGYQLEICNELGLTLQVIRIASQVDADFRNQ